MLNEELMERISGFINSGRFAFAARLAAEIEDIAEREEYFEVIAAAQTEQYLNQCSCKKWRGTKKPPPHIRTYLQI
jgi:hypothetical protein